MSNNYLKATDIAVFLGISEGKAYKIVRQMNEELKSKGYITIAGRVPKAYFEEKWYGGTNGKR